MAIFWVSKHFVVKQKPKEESEKAFTTQHSAARKSTKRLMNVLGQQSFMSGDKKQL
jgi:hypothetical protein